MKKQKSDFDRELSFRESSKNESKHKKTDLKLLSYENNLLGINQKDFKRFLKRWKKKNISNTHF